MAVFYVLFLLLVYRTSAYPTSDPTRNATTDSYSKSNSKQLTHWEKQQFRNFMFNSTTSNATWLIGELRKLQCKPGFVQPGKAATNKGNYENTDTLSYSEKRKLLNIIFHMENTMLTVHEHMLRILCEILRRSGDMEAYNRHCMSQNQGTYNYQ